MKVAHLRGLLAATLFAAASGAMADSMAKRSPLDGVPFGSARSAFQSRPEPVGRIEARDLDAAMPPPAAMQVSPASWIALRPRLAVTPKSVANGLTMSGSWSASWVGSTVSLSLSQVDNDSFSRTTGTLRLELWAVSTLPPRGQGFSGYRLAVFNTLDPLPPRTYYSGIVRTGTMTYPPDGTYWLLLVLSEYDSVNCGQSDRFCVEDTFDSDRTSTFGNATPPPAPTVPTGVEASSFGARATVSGSATAFGGFTVAGSARIYVLVRGNSLGSLGVTQAFMDAPRVRLYNAAGTDLVSQGGRAGFNFCLASNTTTDLPVVQLYQGRGQPVNSRDACYTTVVGAGTYTFSVTPSNGSTSASATSSTFSGEVLFEVTLGRP